MRKRTLAIAVAALVAAGLAAGAFAASQVGSTPQRSFVNDVARHLHVTPAQLTGAVKRALIDRINAAVGAGRLTKAQAAAIKQRIELSRGIPFGGPFFLGPPVPFGGRLQAVPAPPGLPHRQLVPGPGAFGPPFLWTPAVLPAAASYLGIGDAQLFQQLRSGKTLAQIAQARGKTVTGLEQRLEQLSSRRIRSIVTGKLPFGPRGLPGRFYHLHPGEQPRLPGGAILPAPLFFRGWATHPPPRHQAH